VYSELSCSKREETIPFLARGVAVRVTELAGAVDDPPEAVGHGQQQQADARNQDRWPDGGL